MRIICSTKFWKYARALAFTIIRSFVCVNVCALILCFLVVCFLLFLSSFSSLSVDFLFIFRSTFKKSIHSLTNGVFIHRRNDCDYIRNHLHVPISLLEPLELMDLVVRLLYSSITTWQIHMTISLKYGLFTCKS